MAVEHGECDVEYCSNRCISIQSTPCKPFQIQFVAWATECEACSGWAYKHTLGNEPISVIIRNRACTLDAVSAVNTAGRNSCFTYLVTATMGIALDIGLCDVPQAAVWSAQSATNRTISSAVRIRSFWKCLTCLTELTNCFQTVQPRDRRAAFTYIIN